jgi:hypothetical protein
MRPAAAPSAAGSFAVRDKVSCLPLKGWSEGLAGDLYPFETPEQVRGMESV